MEAEKVVKVDKLTDEQLNEILAKCEEISEGERSGKLTPVEARTQLLELQTEMRSTHDPEIKNPLRKLVWDDVNDNLTIIGRKIPQESKIKAGDTLDLEARTKVQEMKRLIRSMTMNGSKKLDENELEYQEKVNTETKQKIDRVNDEGYVLIRLKMLTNYGKDISENHSEVKFLRQLFHDTCLDNYEKFAKAGGDPKRNEGISKKIEGNLALSKYSNPNRAEAIINLLKKPIG